MSCISLTARDARVCASPVSLVMLRYELILDSWLMQLSAAGRHHARMLVAQQLLDTSRAYHFNHMSTGTLVVK